VSTFAREIGPQRVGGRYYCGYWGKEYDVLDIDTDRTAWPAWQITIRWEDGRETSHCTAWDADRDRVIRS
jgi:hypothetical protein